MSKLILKPIGGMVAAVAVAACFTATGSAPARAATTPLYSGGSTLAELVYRDLFSCYGSNSSVAPQLDNGGTGGAGVASGGSAFTTFCSGAAVNSTVEALYAGVGSGDGKLAFTTHNPANLVAGSRTPGGPDKNPHPYSGDLNGGGSSNAYYGSDTGGTYTSGTTPAFPGFQFAGSDDSLIAADLANTGNGYYAPGNPGASGFGPAIQFPTFVTGVAVAFNPLDGNGHAVAQQGKKPAAIIPGYTTYVDFDMNTVCGIFTGAYLTWDSLPATWNNLTNKSGAQYGTGPITVTWRSDNSGTTFIFTNALLNQCGTQSHPVAGITNSVPDQWLTDAGIPNSPPFTSTTGFFPKVNAAHHLPSSFLVGGASGNGGVEAATASTNGAIGYLSPGFVNGYASAPTGAPLAAAVQVAGTASTKPKFAQPTLKAVSAVMAKAVPPSFNAGSCTTATGWAMGTSPDGVCAHNPMNWGVLNPVPVPSSSTYPIGGFTFIDMYSCYANTTEVAALASTKTPNGLWYWHMKNSSSSKIPGKVLNDDGFSVLPSAWTKAIETLLGKDVKTMPRPVTSTAPFADGSTCSGTGA